MLLSRLSLLCAPSLFEGFTLHRLAASPHGLFYGWTLNADTGSRTLYRSYIGALRGGGLAALFVSRPVLARLIATAAELWISMTAAFIERLAADFQAIRRAFFKGRQPGMVTHIRGELSDPHNGGQSVLQVTFSSGLAIGYKPRALGLDSAWRQMIGWLDSHGAPESARAPKVLLRDGYGWVEWISTAPCPVQGGAARFFHRAGATLCLLHFLRGIDFHSENVIASGDTPVPVDLETLVHPVVPDSWRAVDGNTAAGRAARWLRESVLATSYLPKWVALPGGHAAAIGGLNPTELQPAKRLAFTAPNTDGMNYAARKISKPQTSHLPSISGKSLTPGAFHSEFETGYTAMYRFLMSCRHELFAADGPLKAFRGQTVRILLRPTVLYTLLLRRALGKRFLTSGVEWSLQFDILARFSDFFESNANAERIRAAEQRALEQLDVPYFSGRTDSTSLRLPNGTVIEDFLAETSFTQLIRQAERMSEAALSEQVCLIRQALGGVNGGSRSKSGRRAR
jgi:type 2 lantibiotic biosynthesis protein LanM